MGTDAADLKLWHQARHRAEWIAGANSGWGVPNPTVAYFNRQAEGLLTCMIWAQLAAGDSDKALWEAVEKHDLGLARAIPAPTMKRLLGGIDGLDERTRADVWATVEAWRPVGGNAR